MTLPLTACPRRIATVVMFLLCASVFFVASRTLAQVRQGGDEIVANLAGGRVIVHVARDEIIFAAIDQPVEANSIPPRVMSIDGRHIGILFGASEWRLPADPNPVRLDKDFPHVTGNNPSYQSTPGEAEADLETIGIAFLERLRPLVSQLHHKIDFKPEESLFEVVLIGYAPQDYGPEIWTIEYHVQQEQIATRGDFWQTRVLRPRFTQLYPPDKKEPKTLVETRYPADAKGPTLLQLIQGNEPDLDRLSSKEAKFAKVVDFINRGQANKAVSQDASDLMRAELPLIAENARFLMGTITEHGFDWVVPPDEPVEKAKEDKNRPPDAPSLHPKIKP